MKIFNFKIFSRNKESITQFYSHLFYRINIKHNFKLIQKSINLKKKKKKVTLLKSPHINKNAQEHFEFLIFKKKYNVLTTNYLKFLNFLKKIKTERFADVYTILTFKIQNSTSKIYKNNNFFLDIFFYQKKKNCVFLINKKRKNFYLKKQITCNFLKILDIFGEKSLNFLEFETKKF